jgi:hypothetical protein
LKKWLFTANLLKISEYQLKLAPKKL